ncbi:translation initiation factor eIF3 core subunit c SCDLUD_004427 [Saccharomycodes ludwigii]|uniref:translation initiation factor eIF3 core subunit c n=1 Tax=Saccharomycodes ludwigii TaxID=36035 RepID=UPI001E8B0B5F|nr:hypothetical protein SCDLUD_004427 [Saccharomycodes ludwigii]KAH3899006.1 hypothetical protein SCDLUD_004427 [Saccharomycodes ludwigii]
MTSVVLRFFQPTYDYDSSSEEELLSQDETEETHNKFLAKNAATGYSSSSDEEELLDDEEDEGNKTEDSDDSLFNNNSDDSDLDDDSDSKPYGPDWFKKPQFRKGGNGSSPANKFLKGADYSSDEDNSSDDDYNSGFDGKKTAVKSAKDKLFDEFETVHKKIDVAELTNDWVSVLNEFDQSSKLFTRSQQQNFGGVPSVYIKIISQVEEAVNAATANNEELFKKNKVVSRAFNTTKQRVKKLIREYSVQLDKYRSNPELFDKIDVIVDENSAANIPVAVPSLSGESPATIEFFTVLNAILESRGKKNSDLNQQIATLETLLAEKASTPYEKIVAYANLIPMRFESTNNMSYQPLNQWDITFNDICDFLQVLEDNIDHYHFSETAPKNDFIEIEPTPNDESGVKEILGSIFAFVERLDSEFNSSLLNIDHRSSEYLKRLRDEQKVYNLLLRTQLYLEKTLPETVADKVLTRLLIIRLDHIYYKPCNLVYLMEKKAWGSGTVKAFYKSSKFVTFEDGQETPQQYSFRLLNTLTNIFHNKEKNDQVVLRKRATLYHVYFYALNGEYDEACRMLENSYLKQSINNAPGGLQILYNRVIVQLGFSAFKLCLIEDTQQILYSVVVNSYVKEAMGQKPLPKNVNSLDIVAAADLTTTATTNANSRDDSTTRYCELYLPYHKHINLELIDAVFMSCSLLNEVPRIAAFNARCNNVIKASHSQKSIRKILDNNERSSYQGPPETLRDYILYAAKSMQRGDWKDCLTYLLKTPITRDLISSSPHKDEILKKLTARIQEQSLITYFFNYKRFYSKLSVEELCKIFNLEHGQVVDILQDVINKHELEDTCRFDDESRKYIVLEKGQELPKLEEIAVKLHKEKKARSYAHRMNNGNPN